MKAVREGFAESSNPGKKEQINKQNVSRRIKGMRMKEVFMRRKQNRVLTAIAVTAILIGSGVGAKAAYDSVAARMESMSEEERREYVTELENDTSVTIDGSWSRKLTNDEVLRLAALEREYYGENVFPEQEVQHVKTLADWDGQSVCYVEEDGLLHLPKSEMTDEQLLQFIDHTEKYNYVMEEEAEEYPAEEEEDDLDLSNLYADVENATQDELIDCGYRELKDFFGIELGDEWHARVEAFQPSACDPDAGDIHDAYYVYWEQAGGTSYSSEYVVCYGMHDLKLRVVAVGGREHWAGLGSYSEEEGMAKAEKDKEKVLTELKERYGFGKPDSERMEVYHEYDEEGDARQARYVFTYGILTVDVLWDLADERMASVEMLEF